MTAVRRTLPAALVICALGALPAAATAAASARNEGLSPDLAELARPSVRELPHRAQAQLLDLPPTGPGSLIREGGKVLVNVGFESGALGRLGAIEDVGAEIAAASSRYQTVTAAVAPADLRSLAAVPGVDSVTANPAPIVHAAGSCEGGSVISEGVEQLGVPAARQAFGLRGAGVTVGVLSDSYDIATEEAFGGGPILTHADEDIQSDDIPGPAGTCGGQQTGADVLEDGPSSPAGQVHDEGRAMLQIVHDVAPHAKLAFATAFISEISFAENIERLARPVSEGGAGANVIVDDVSWLEEPFFQDGPVANAIAKVVSQGVTYLTAAGNENLISEGHEIASWEAPEFRDAPSCPAAVQLYLVGKGFTPDCMDFNPNEIGVDSGFGLTVKGESEVTVDLQWAEPWYGVSTDLDAFLVSGGQVVAKKEEDNVSETKKPVEWLRWKNAKAAAQEVQLVINRCIGTCNPKADPLAKPRLKFILRGGVTKSEYPVSMEGDVVGPTIFGHSASTTAITLGAVRYSNSAKPETYSSRGPAKHFFAPAAGKSASAPIVEEVIAKPDVVATDCGATTFFAEFAEGAWRFCGTSAAAPHAAGIAALMVQGAAASPLQVREGLEDSALPVGTFGPAAVGAGLIDAKGALEAVAAVPTSEDGPSPTVPPVVEYEPEKEKEKTPTEPPTSPPTTPTSPTPTISINTQPPVETKAAPATVLLTRPKKVVSTYGALARVLFRFGSEPVGASFRCQFDGSPWRACTGTVVRWFGLGPHVIRVEAKAGKLYDLTPVVYRFRVARSR
jgi:Subtilase family